MNHFLVFHQLFINFSVDLMLCLWCAGGAHHTQRPGVLGASVQQDIPEGSVAATEPHHRGGG